MDAIIGLHSCSDPTIVKSDILITTVKILQTLVDIPVKEQRQTAMKQKRIAF